TADEQYGDVDQAPELAREFDQESTGKRRPPLGRAPLAELLPRALFEQREVERDASERRERGREHPAPDIRDGRLALGQPRPPVLVDVEVEARPARVPGHLDADAMIARRVGLDMGDVDLVVRMALRPPRAHEPAREAVQGLDGTLRAGAVNDEAGDRLRQAGRSRRTRRSPVWAHDRGAGGPGAGA